MASDWLSEWLESLNLSEYVGLFTEHGYTASEDFLSVDKSELRRLGLAKVGHQNRLLRAVDKIRSDADVSTPPPSSLSQHPSRTDGPSNGLPPDPVNSDPSNHAPIPTQSPPLSPVSSSLSTSRLTSPPPVPLHRSFRKVSSGSLPPTPTTSNSTSQFILDVPPPVKPRQQSLRRRSQSPEELPLPSTVSATLPTDMRHPHKSQSTSSCSLQEISRDKAVSDPIIHNHTAAESDQMAGVKPKPSPRTHRKTQSTSSQLNNAPVQRPVPLPRKTSAKKNWSEDVVPITVGGSGQTPMLIQVEGGQISILSPMEGDLKISGEGGQTPILPSNHKSSGEGGQTPILPPKEGDHKSSGEGDQMPILPPKEGDHKSSGEGIHTPALPPKEMLSTVEGGHKATLPPREGDHILAQNPTLPLEEGGLKTVLPLREQRRTLVSGDQKEEFPHGERITLPPKEGDLNPIILGGQKPELPPKEGGQSAPLPHPRDEADHATGESSEEEPPALPAKRPPKSQSRKVIAPEEDVVFELEDVPIPDPHTTASSQVDSPRASESQPTPPTSSMVPPPSPTKRILPPIPRDPSSFSSLGGECEAEVEQDSAAPVEIEVPPPPPQQINSVRQPPPIPRDPSSSWLEAECEAEVEQDSATPEETEVPPPLPQHVRQLPPIPKDSSSLGGECEAEVEQDSVAPVETEVPPPPPQRINSVRQPPPIPRDPSSSSLGGECEAEVEQDSAAPVETEVPPPPPQRINSVRQPPPIPRDPSSSSLGGECEAEVEQDFVAPEETEVPPPPPQRINSVRQPPPIPRDPSSSSLGGECEAELEQDSAAPEETEIRPPPPQRINSVRQPPPIPRDPSSSSLGGECEAEVEQDSAAPEETEVPPPPPQRINSVRNQRECATSPPPPLPPSTVNIRPHSPPLPAPHRSTPPTLDQTVPPLPPKDTPTLPSFTPSPPPLSPSPPISSPPSPPHSPTLPHPTSEPPLPENSTLPPLPPKFTETPPPPPPLFDRYDTEDDFSDSDEEDDGKFLSITSSLKSPSDDDVLTVSTGRLESPLGPDSLPSPLTALSSEETTPRHIVQQPVYQQGGAAGNIMVLTPQPPVIVEPTQDYANQEAIDKAIAEAEGDYADCNKVGTVRGSTPIRSRTLNPEQCDYINQEVLDEDILPVVLAPASAAPVLIPESMQSDSMETREQDTRDYVNLRVDERAQVNGSPESSSNEVLRRTSDPQNDIFADPSKVLQIESLQTSRRSVSPDRSSLNPVDEKETTLDFGRTSLHTLTLDQGASKPPISISSGASSSATTSASLFVDSDYFELKEIDVLSKISPPVGSGFNRTAASMYRPTGSGQHELPPLPSSSGTFACHQQSRHTQHKHPGKHTQEKDTVDYSHELISPLSDRPEDLENVPRTKEGYLHKKGGKRSQRPWQKRWVVFSGEELKYFNDKNYKESDALNHVRLRDMIDVKQINDAQVNSDRQHRFDLVVIGRVFQFYSESREDCESWVTVLHAAIARFQPQESEKIKEGGSLHDPEKQGILLKQGRGMRQGFRERYIALKGSKFAYYENKEAFINARPIHILELALANVRPDPSGKHRFIITMHNQKTYTFQALNDMERADWLENITTAILAGLVGEAKVSAPPAKKEATVQDIMARIQENPANKVCADCLAPDPSWGVVNLGIMVCIECSGVHRSMGILVSKVRSLELDQSIWTDSLIKLMVEIGNDRSNLFWEKHYKQERLQADVERDIRESFIRAKYQDHSWIPQPSGESREALSRQLHVCVASNNLMRSIQLLVHGADACFEDPDECNPELKTSLGIAKHHKQDLQVELLEQNRALSCQRSETHQLISKRGHLYKTGNDRTGWRRRWCTLDQFRGMEYFRSETDPEVQGDIKIHEMLSISRCDDENMRDPKYSHCFEVNTQSRGYLFCADSKEDMEDWIVTLEKVIPRDGAEKLGLAKVGYLRKKDPHNVGGWKRRWFTLKGKSLVYYRREREELAEIDLKKVTELKPPDPSGTAEAQCSFQISLPERVHYLKAETPADADSWIQALRHTQVSGIPLSEQQTTAGGIPIIVHKCLQFVETFGLEVEGIYRMSGNISKIRKLILGFNQDAQGFMIDCEDFTVHDVAGALKDFFKTLPDPLLTHHLYPTFIKIMQSDHEQQMYQLKAHIEKLPAVNRETLKRVIGHLRRVIDHESKNKMGKLNLVSLFAPTLMTVNADAVSMANHKHEFACMDRMIEFYKWLFEVNDKEEAREKEFQEAKKRIMEAAEKSKVTNLGMTSNMKFLNTIYILNKSGDTYGTYITPVTLVGEVVEEVTTNKALPPDHYALYLVIGEFDSYRVLSSSDRLLGALSSVGSDCYLCLKPNAFFSSIRPFMQRDGWETVQVHVREKRKWKRYPCAVRANSFIQFKDNKCINEVARLALTELDVFAGMERSIRTDHKNPMPTRHFFWLKPMRGLEEQTKYLCADSEQDLLRLMAALVKAKYGPEGLQTPLLPTRPPPPEMAARRSTVNVSPRRSPNIQRKDQFGSFGHSKT